VSKPRTSGISRPLGGVLACSLLAVAGCAAVTPDARVGLAWERWERCRATEIRLYAIEPTGRLTIVAGRDLPRSGELWTIHTWEICIRNVMREQIEAGRLQIPVEPPYGIVALDELVSFVYFTDLSPTPGIPLRRTIGSFMAPRRDEFDDVSAVTMLIFFRPVPPLRRTVFVESQWRGPENYPIASVEGHVDLSIPHSDWLWQRHRAPDWLANREGQWSVALLIDGIRVGRYYFKIMPVSVSRP